MPHMLQQEKMAPPRKAKRYPAFQPFLFLLAMAGASIVLNAVLPLYGFWFHTSLTTRFGQWVLLPTHILFPGLNVNPNVLDAYAHKAPPVALSWLELPLLAGAFTLIFLCYLLALRFLPARITKTFLLLSTGLLGLLCALAPVVTSTDVFSYITYARLGVVYHLNPLTALPLDIRSDPVYIHLYWIHQPSAYGPTWIGITALLQWLVLPFGVNAIAPMVLALRLLGLLAHLGSVLLIWSIVGQLQLHSGHYLPRRRMLAALAFAWNPLLLHEACVNAHADTVLLFFVLLALWTLSRSASPAPRVYLGSAVILALATCLKANCVLLIPGLLLFQWKHQPGMYGQRLRSVAATGLLYSLCIVTLYAPFWQHGAVLNVLSINPGAHRNINTLPEFISHLYDSVSILLGAAPPPDIGSVAEQITHSISLVIFLLLYAYLCWQLLQSPSRALNLLHLLRWMLLAWLAYCFAGSPWFWPWYLTLCFGLFAIITSVNGHERMLPLENLYPIMCALTLSMLTLYCFYPWGVYDSFVPFLPGFRWAYLRGLWAWSIPLLTMYVVLACRAQPIIQRYQRRPDQVTDGDTR